jgi:hypothetical protein
MRGSMVIRRAVGVATGRIDLEAKDGQRGQRGPRGPHGRGGPMHERGPIDEDADGVNEM